jgi:anthranilate phosphoribosyltransferase
MVGHARSGHSGFPHCLRALARPEAQADMAGDEARQLFAAMLDGGVPELELGGLLVALGTRAPDIPVLLGFYDALRERVLALAPVGAERRAIVMPAYGGALRQPNLTPLVALILQRMAIPVLIHGTLDGHGRIATAYILRELGVLPCGTQAQAQAALERDHLAFVPTGLIAPGLAQLLALRGRIGIDGACQTLAQLIDPFDGAGLRLVASDDPAELERLRALLLDCGETALVMAGTEGEAFVNPRRRPRIELVSDGAATLLFGREHGHDDAEEAEAVSAELEPRATAAHIRAILAGNAKLPLPIVNQLACCLYASGYAGDFNQAKAIIAVETRNMAVA